MAPNSVMPPSLLFIELELIGMEPPSLIATDCIELRQWRK